MDLVIVQIIRIFLDYRVACVTSTTTDNYSVATLSPESLLNDCEKPNQPKKLLFLKCDLIWLNFRAAYIRQFSGMHSAEVVFMNPYRKHGRSRKLLDSVSINPVLSTIKLLR